MYSKRKSSIQHYKMHSVQDLTEAKYKMCEEAEKVQSTTRRSNNYYKQNKNDKGNRISRCEP